MNTNGTQVSPYVGHDIYGNRPKAGSSEADFPKHKPSLQQKSGFLLMPGPPPRDTMGLSYNIYRSTLTLLSMQVGPRPNNPAFDPRNFIFCLSLPQNDDLRKKYLSNGYLQNPCLTINVVLRGKKAYVTNAFLVTHCVHPLGYRCTYTYRTYIRDARIKHLVSLLPRFSSKIGFWQELCGHELNAGFLRWIKRNKNFLEKSMASIENPKAALAACYDRYQMGLSGKSEPGPTLPLPSHR